MATARVDGTLPEIVSDPEFLLMLFRKGILVEISHKLKNDKVIN